MIFNLKAEQIDLKNLSLLVKLAGSKTGVDALSNVLIEAVNGSVKMTASDGKTVTTLTINDVSIKNEGSCCVNAAKLLSVCSGLVSEAKFSSKGDALIVSKDTGKYTINGIPYQNFPKLNIGDIPPFLSISSSIFNNILRRGSFCLDVEGRNPNLEGVYLEFDGNEARITSTDGVRLVSTACPFNSVKANIFIPRYFVPYASQFIGNIGISEVGNHYIFKCDNINSVVTKSTAKFPNYRPLIADKDIIFNLAGDAIFKRLNGILSMADDLSSVVKIVVENNNLTISSNDNNGNDGVETIYDIGFASNYESLIRGLHLRQFLQSCKDSSVGFDLKDKIRLYLDEDGCQTVFVLLPVKVK